MNRKTIQRTWLALGLGAALALGNSAWSQEEGTAASQPQAGEVVAPQEPSGASPEGAEAAPDVQPEIPAAYAEATAPASEPALKRGQPPHPASGKTLFNVMAALVAVIVMIFATGWLLKRFSGFSTLNNRHLKIHASLSVGARERIVLIEVGGEQILVGVTPQQINHLHTLKEPVVSPAAPAQGEFAQRLQAILRKGKTE